MQLRTQLARPPSRHAAAHPERFRLVGGGKHDAAADGDRLAAQRRVEQLLDRGVEGVEVGMQDARALVSALVHRHPPLKGALDLASPRCARKLNAAAVDVLRERLQIPEHRLISRWAAHLNSATAFRAPCSHHHSRSSCCSRASNSSRSTGILPSRFHSRLRRMFPFCSRT